MARRNGPDPPPRRLPAVVVTPDPSAYGAGKVYRRSPDGPLLYDSPFVTQDGKRPTHRLTDIIPRLKPGQTIDDYEREVAQSAPRIAGEVERSLAALEPDVQAPLQSLLQRAQEAGVRLRVGETRRTQERQNALFAQGRGGSGAPVTWTLTSNHTPGRAADLVADTAEGYRWIQQNAPQFGFRVLGDSDPGHVELPASAARPQMEEIERLERALRNAHAAGDTAAAKRFAAEIRRLRAEGGAPATTRVPTAAPTRPAEPALPRGMAAALATGHRSDPPPRGAQRGGSVPVANPPAPQAMGAGGTWTPSIPAALAAGHGGSTDVQLTPAEEARLDVATMNPLQQRHAAQTQGIGSAALGIGTPLSAAGRMIGTALPGGDAPAGPGAALEYARERRDALRDERPGAYYSGMGAGIVAPAGVAKAAVSKLPAAARSVFSLQSGQTLANIGRLSALGATAAGTTELLEQGPAGVPGAAAAGAVLGPLAAGAAGAVNAVGTRIAGFISPTNSALRVLARRLGEPVDDLAARYNRFTQTMGRRPRLNEIMRQEASEELAMMGRTRTDAGAILRRGAEAARVARPAQLERVVRNRGNVTSVPAVEARMAETAEAAGAAASRGFRTTAPEVIGARDVELDNLMETIGGHRVPMTQDILEVVRSPDVAGALPAALRRRIAAAIEQGEDTGMIDLTVREWDMIRQSLMGRTGAGAGQIYRELRDTIRDYVGRAVPEYAEGLRRWGELTDVARGIKVGRTGLAQDANLLAGRMRTAGGGTPATPRRPEVRHAENAGIQIGARERLATLLSGDEAKVRRTMEKLAGDPQFRANVRATLQPSEADELMQLGERYGFQIDFRAGVQRGKEVMAQETTEEFREAVAQAGRTERTSIRTGARTQLSEAAGESPASAVSTAARLAEDPGLHTRITWALGGDEARRLREVGRTSTAATRNMEAAVPAGTQASARWAEYAQEVQKYIGAGVIAWGRASGALIANAGNWIVQRTSLSSRAAKLMAQRAMSPHTAAQTIEQLRRIGVSADDILDMYRSAAIAAGIAVGGD